MASESRNGRHGAPPSGGAPWSEFEQLYRDHQDKLTTYVTRRGFSPADASDIVSTSFANLWRLWQEQERPRDPTPYLYQVVKRRMIDHLRREKQEADRGVVYAPQDVIDAVSPVEEFTDSFHAIGLRDAETAAARGISKDHFGSLDGVPAGVPGEPAAEAHVNRRDAQKRDRPPEPGEGLPLDFEAFYLGYQEAFHAYAEAHFGTHETAQEIVHTAFLEILAAWPELLTSKSLEQGAWAIVRRVVRDRLKPAFATKSPIADVLTDARNKLRMLESSSGLYEAIAELPNRQFEVIVLRYLLGYPTSKISWYLGIDERTVGHHLRRGRERLRVKLGLPEYGSKRGRTDGS
ncbi:sigma-70 family RNA polymerase sigma factor [Streptomyces lasalocidi]|uniref:Sigma-70 family RNA polymerase sigma factor n=1 Tax=Streptomyces lasalocidi TaxID=324833 RepID=A0A4U5W4L0_STRLS|nr:sigma-70 family RNA polymerase sigma factor [Streptomyces lasalocidi]TKS96376.1 sigma-70 family RNA polymerase sigma factor [Streptomyces lasalocidi]